MATKTLIGLDDVKRALLETPKEARAVFRDVITVTTRIITQRTQQAAPYDTGALREALIGSPPKGSSLTGYVKIQPGQFRGKVPSSYVLAVEYGRWIKENGRPFIRPTAEAESGPYVARLIASGKTLERNLEARGGRFL